MTLAEQVASVRRTLYRLLTRRLSERTDRPFMQLHALKAIGDEEVRSQAALAERLLVDAPAVSRLVDRLEQDGLLKRCAGDDRRCVRLEATAAGLRELEALHVDLQWLDGEVRRHLTAQEVRVLQHLLEKLHAGLLQSRDFHSSEEDERAE